MESTIICITIELFIGLLVIVLVWLRNLYKLIKYPEIYKIYKIDTKEKLECLNNYTYSTALNFLSLDYIFIIVKYENNMIVKKTFYNLFGDYISVRDNEEDSEVQSQWTYMYSFLVTLPLFLGIFLRLFRNFIYLYNKDLISYNDIFFSVIFWLLIGFFFPTMLKQFVSELIKEWQKVKDEEK